MSNQKLNDVLSYLETALGAVSDLRGKVIVTKDKEPVPGLIRDYGVQVYLGNENPKEVQYRKIGPIAHETWHINTDLVFNRNLQTRQLYSEAKGLSYWENLLHSTLFHKTNDEVFQDSWWEFLNQKNLDDSVILQGMFHCEVVNRY